MLIAAVGLSILLFYATNWRIQHLQARYLFVVLPVLAFALARAGLAPFGSRGQTVVAVTAAAGAFALSVWGAFLLAGGAGLFGFALTALIRRTPAVSVRDDGLSLALGAPGEEPMFVPWSSISFVSSAAEKNPNGGYDRDVLVVDIIDPAGLPAEPWGASWKGNRLVVDAGGWDKPIDEVVIHAGIALDHYQHLTDPRLAAIGPGDTEPADSGALRPEPEEVPDD